MNRTKRNIRRPKVDESNIETESVVEPDFDPRQSDDYPDGPVGMIPDLSHQYSQPLPQSPPVMQQNAYQQPNTYQQQGSYRPSPGPQMQPQQPQQVQQQMVSSNMGMQPDPGFQQDIRQSNMGFNPDPGYQQMPPAQSQGNTPANAGAFGDAYNNQFVSQNPQNGTPMMIGMKMEGNAGLEAVVMDLKAEITEMGSSIYALTEKIAEQNIQLEKLQKQKNIKNMVLASALTFVIFMIYMLFGRGI